MTNNSSILKPSGGDVDRLSDLLKNDVFVDFFNTFLNLPVFGQTPLFFLSDNKWLTCPELLQGQEVNRGGFQKWLTAHRFTLFKETELFHYYTLCKEFLEFSNNHSEVLKWTTADQWLLRRCIGSGRGMRRFSTFIKGTCGKELVSFCVRVSRLFNMDCEDAGQKHRYLALLTVIRSIHLTEGSSIMAICHIPRDTMISILSSELPDSARKQIIGQMYNKALHRLQHYWLPQFLRYCKDSLWRDAECSHIVQEYSAIASHSASEDVPGIPAQLDPGLGQVKEAELTGSATGTYCSKNTKRLLWMRHEEPQNRSVMAARETEKIQDGRLCCQWLRLEGETGQERCTNAVHSSQTKYQIDATTEQYRNMPDDAESQTCSKQTSKVDNLKSSHRSGNLLPNIDVEGVREGEVLIPHTCMETPAYYQPSVLPAPPAPATPESHRFNYLQPALSADSLAGGPLAAFLRARGLETELQHLGLWQDLDLVLSLVLRAQGDDSLHSQRQAVARRITHTYLGESAVRVGLLESDTSRQLRRLLPSGAVIPWIYTAKHEICKVLCASYDSFLDEDDKHFCSCLESAGVNCGQRLSAIGQNTKEQQVRRMREALALCQSCCTHGATEQLSDWQEDWALMALEDVKRGGSVHLHYKKTEPRDLPFDLLAVRYPKLALENLSVNYLLYQKKKPFSDGESSKPVSAGSMMKKAPLMLKKDNSFVRMPSMRPRSFGDVLRNPVSLDYFKRFLRFHYAQGALLFTLEVEKLKAIDRPKPQKIKILAIVNKFLRREDPMGYLQCSADVISQAAQMRTVSCEVLYTIQDLVTKSLEGTWFKQYQDTFPHCPAVGSDSCLRGAILKTKLKNVWLVFCRFIKTVCKFQTAMKDPRTRTEFELYLRMSYRHFSESCDSRAPPKDEGDTSHMKSRVINGKVIIIDFLINDLSFYLESERFRNLADSGTVMASAGMYGENDHAMLHQKADMIIKIFLKSEISPKLRINIAETQRDAILQQCSTGKVDRGLFHPAIVTIFPNLVFCWKKFCNQKLTKNLDGVKATKKQEVSSTPDYMGPLLIDNDWYRKVKTIMSITEDHTTLRFTVHHGLKLILPQAILDLKRSHNNMPLPHKAPSPQRSVPSYSGPHADHPVLDAHHKPQRHSFHPPPAESSIGQDGSSF
uniref:Regulator of G protein signaling like 1 n=2 Tax=Oncorhynchus kisutch TaxID=8019 RepID=A0A8C7FW59_ONCKI